MNMNTIVKLIKNPEVTSLNNEKAMVDFETGKYFLLKGSANDIWDYIQEEISVSEIVSKLKTIYDVSEEECFEGVTAFLDELQSNGFVELK